MATSGVLAGDLIRKPSDLVRRPGPLQALA